MDRINPILGYLLTMAVGIGIAFGSAYFYGTPDKKSPSPPLPSSKVKYSSI